MSSATLDPADASQHEIPSAPAAPSETWQARLGVGSDVNTSNLIGFLLLSAASITFLVYLNSIQPFLLGQLGEHTRQGSLAGSLVFADELLSLFLALVWGSSADVFGTKPVALIAFVFIAAGLASFTLASHAWPDLLWARLVFAVGGSGATTMLSGILTSYSVPPRSTMRDESGVTEPLLEDAGVGEQPSLPSAPRNGRLAGMAGISTGLGALVGVFGLLRLPILLATLHDKHSPRETRRFELASGSIARNLSIPQREPDLGTDDPSVRQGTREAFWIVATLAILVAIILAFTLKSDTPGAVTAPPRRRAAPRYGSSDGLEGHVSHREARRARLRDRLRTSRARAVLQGAANVARGSLRGLYMARNDQDLALALVGGALARGITIAVTVFVPLLVTRYFYTSGLCSTLPSPDLPPSELKKACRAAFTAASILGGVIQLSALLLAPLAGYLCDAYSPAATLGGSAAVGAAGFAILALGLPGGDAWGEGDPRAKIAWLAAIAIGWGQIGAIVSSLALCVRVRGKWDTSREENSRDQSSERATLDRRSAGAIAGAYSCTGGLSVLLTSKVGGSLSDLFTPAPFLLLGGLAILVSVWSAALIVRRQ